MADDSASIDVLNSTAQLRLKTIVERIERLEEDKAAVAADIKEVMSEAKGEGFDPKIIRKVVKWRAQDPAKRQEEDALLDLYLSALGALGPDVTTSVVDGIPRITVHLAAPASPKPQTKFQSGADAEAVASARGRGAAQEQPAKYANPYEPGSAQHKAYAEGFRSEAVRLGVEI